MYLRLLWTPCVSIGRNKLGIVSQCGGNLQEKDSSPTDNKNIQQKCFSTQLASKENLRFLT